MAAVRRHHLADPPATGSPRSTDKAVEITRISVTQGEPHLL